MALGRPNFIVNCRLSRLLHADWAGMVLAPFDMGGPFAEI